jgi:hypothetical protein
MSFKENTYELMKVSIYVVARLKQYIIENADVDITREYADSVTFIKNGVPQMHIKITSVEGTQNMGIYVSLQNETFRQEREVLIMNFSDKDDDAQISRLIAKCIRLIDVYLSDMFCSASGLYMIKSWSIDAAMQLLLNRESHLPEDVLYHMSDFTGTDWIDF